MKKILSLMLAIIMAVSVCTVSVTGFSAESVTVTAAKPNALYAHAYEGDAADSEAWVKWYEKDGKMYFFLPTGTDPMELEIYNSFGSVVTVNNTKIEPNTSAVVSFTDDSDVYTAEINGKEYTIVFMVSSAEAAMFINNPSSFDGKDLWAYLTEDKENNASATSALLDEEGNLDSTPIKKIKGRGNTSWDADKKGFNITFDSAVKVGNMQKCKKFSIISNFQDASLSRNRILYDLADEIGVPYASDSRFTEVYVNGEYIGNYQVCEKVDVGKNTLMPDIDDEEYLSYCAGEAPAFSFVCEIDANPDEDDFTVKASNGNNLTMKAPELERGDSNYAKTRTFIKNKYDTMYSKLVTNAADINNYIDIESLAQVYLINELGKNWDAGAGSFFFVYKQDENGKWKFFASPVWDYDNSLGNAQGVEWDLNNMGIKDYEEPTGWFAKHKNGYRGPNFLKESVSKNKTLQAMIPVVWFEQFVPAVENKLNGTGLNDTELYSSDVYLSKLTRSAQMNFIRWNIIQEPQWIADHTSLKQCHATYQYNKFGQITGVNYSQDKTATRYDQYVFEAEYQYMLDWTNSRVAWMSSQYINDYTPSEPEYLRGDADMDGQVSIMDATAIQLHIASLEMLSDLGAVAADVDDDSEISIIDATEIQLFIAGLVDVL